MTIPLDPVKPTLTSPARGPDEASAHGTSLWRGAWVRLRRNPAAIIGATLVLAFVLVSVFAPLIAPYPANNTRWADEVTLISVPGPRDGNLLGLDRYGSDLFSQLIFGARQSLIVGVVSTALGLAAGAVLGIIAGGLGSWADTFVMRVVDLMLSIPSLLLAVSIVAVLGQNRYAVMIAIAAAQVPIFARLLRGTMLSQSKSDYVLAATSLGLRRRTIVLGHVLPNSLGPTIVQATLNLSTAIIEVAALSFLGLGESDPAVAEWGRMLVAAQDRFDQSPQLAMWPGFAIAVSALGFTLLGEALREALDPKGRR
ncbi:MAG: ABC transporter permease [Propionibacteriales bacterium]|nr:ABC transporter permease [Propionibacteriales bacterium]